MTRFAPMKPPRMIQFFRSSARRGTTLLGAPGPLEPSSLPSERENHHGHRRGPLGAYLVETVVLPLPDAQHDLELRRGEHRLLVPQGVLDRDARAGGVDPSLHAVTL